MSSPDQDDVDKKLRLAVPWVSDPERQDLRDEETRRLQEDIIAAAKRLESESGETCFARTSKPATMKMPVTKRARPRKLPGHPVFSASHRADGSNPPAQ